MKKVLESPSVYKAFGLTIYSEIKLPELIREEKIDHIDVVISTEDLSALWEKQGNPNSYIVIKQNYCLFRVPNVAIYLIECGKKISVSPLSNSKDDLLRLYLLGTCFGVLLMQRGILPLHGSAIEIKGKAYAIVGESGAGKSTLASAFLRKGYRLISDDVIPVTLNHNHQPFVSPAYPQQKLWNKSLENFGVETHNYQPIAERETKFAIPVKNQFVEETLPLVGVIELVRTDDEMIHLRQILSLERLHTLFTHTYRNLFLSPSGLMEWHFQLITKIVEQINIYQLCRPQKMFTAYQLTDVILSTIKQEERIYG